MAENWTSVGAEYNATDEQKKRIRAAIEEMQWLKIPEETQSVSLMFGEGVKATIRELHIPKVSHVADSFALAPYGLYGIRAHYSNADVDIFVVDEGCSILPVLTIPTEKPALSVVS